MNKTIRTRIEMQGFINLSDSELSEIRPWIKLAPALCLLGVGIGMVTQSSIVFAILIPIAALGSLLPWHPFDLFYSLMIRHWIQGPAIPHYRAPRKIACGVATAWLTVVFVAFNADHIVAANVLAGLFLVTAALPVVIDFCVPSFLYQRCKTWFDQKRHQIDGGSAP